MALSDPKFAKSRNRKKYRPDILFERLSFTLNGFFRNNYSFLRWVEKTVPTGRQSPGGSLKH